MKIKRMVVFTIIMCMMLTIIGCSKTKDTTSNESENQSSNTKKK